MILGLKAEAGPGLHQLFRLHGGDVFVHTALHLGHHVVVQRLHVRQAEEGPGLRRFAIDLDLDLHRRLLVSRETVPPSFMLGQGDADEAQYYQAEVFLREGGQNYDVMDWTQEDLIQDIIDQYERHLYFLNIVRGTAS